MSLSFNASAKVFSLAVIFFVLVVTAAITSQRHFLNEPRSDGSLGPSVLKIRSLNSSLSPVNSEAIAGLDVMWQHPAKAHMKGLLLVFHGCAHSGSDFFECEECLGLPEERAIVVNSLMAGLAVASISSSDRHYSRCWSRDDIEPTIRIISTLQERLELSHRPLFALGASSGGGFVGKLATKMKHGAMTAVSSQVMGWSDDTFSRGAFTNKTSAPAVEFVTMTRDHFTEQLVRLNVETGAAYGVTVSHRVCAPLKLTATFFSQRTKWASKPISADVSEQIHSALLRAGFIDARSGLLVEDPRESDWQMLLHRTSPAIDGIEDVEMGPDESALSEVMNVAWAQHEICSGEIGTTLSFFRKAAGTRWA